MNEYLVSKINKLHRDDLLSQATNNKLRQQAEQEKNRTKTAETLRETITKQELSDARKLK